MTVGRVKAHLLHSIFSLFLTCGDTILNRQLPSALFPTGSTAHLKNTRERTRERMRMRTRTRRDVFRFTHFRVRTIESTRTGTRALELEHESAHLKAYIDC